VKLKAAVVCGAVVALAVPAIAGAAQAENKVTGGGQFLVPTDGGAGSTIAFVAQGTQDAAKGQIQTQDRSGDAKVNRHGTVQCVAVTGNTAKIAGTWRNGSFFHLYVEDNGQGSKAVGADGLVLDYDADDNQCDFDTPDETSDLGRGNIKVHSGDSGSSSKSSQKASWTKALTLAKLTL
jgi:hypothetical protein